MPTKIIKQLTEHERKALAEELISNNSLWTNHSKLYPTSLRDGRSIHVNRINDKLKYIDDKWSQFPKTHNIIKEIAQGNVIGRCYWHRLMSTDTILPHTDKSLAFVIKDQLHARYQIYLDCPNDPELTMLVVDATKKNPIDFQHSLIDFDLRLTHRYQNLSTEPWYFLVFDVLKDGVKLIK